MKIIAVLPVKNEAWILRYTLQNLSVWADHIIIADQYSTDGSLEIYKDFPKVHCINNPHKGHSNQVRWLLLDTARSLFGNNNLIVCIDADEVIPPQIFKKDLLGNSLKPGATIQMPWIQLWQTVKKYRNDDVWKDSQKIIAFVDNGKMDYERTFVINDHTSRVPTKDGTGLISFNTPLLHLQFVAWDRFQWKQSWYRCSELVQGKNARYINNKYSPTLLSPDDKLLETPQDWLKDIILPADLHDTPAAPWHKETILGYFREYGIGFFEPLQIWHIKELRGLFIQIQKRQPKIKTFPQWLLLLNKLRHKLLHH